MPKPISADIPDSKVSPDPKLEKRTRRIFPPEYQLMIIGLADTCSHKELGPVLRREGSYNVQLKQWCDELAASGIEGLTKSQPGPKSTLTTEQKEIERRRKQTIKLQRELGIANGCLELQKKALPISI